MKRFLLVIPAALFAGLVWLFYAGLSGPPPSQLPSPLVGKPAPDFTLPALSGDGFTRGDLASGHATIVNFWASWCAPCRVEHPLLEALAAREGVTLYGVAWKNKPDQAQGFLEELGDPFARTNVDVSGRVGIDWGIAGVPETFVVDRQGVIRAHYAGPLTPEIVANSILPALTQATALTRPSVGPAPRP